MSVKDLPAAAWAAIWRWTGILTIVSVIVSVLTTYSILVLLSGSILLPGLAVSIALPAVLCGPMSFVLLVRMQEFRQENEKLQVLASTDWLTACLNRRAFTHTVATRLAMADRPGPAARGALLVIDADHFKLINDVFGHDRGDEALQFIAGVIRAKVRDVDLVCRMGGEEFGVFLDGADLDTATLIAERIRKGISRIRFAPAGAAHPLSVSIGGAQYEGRIGFSELFRLADQNLYVAKQSGRDCCEIGAAPDRPTVARDPRQHRLNLAGTG